MTINIAVSNKTVKNEIQLDGFKVQVCSKHTRTRVWIAMKQMMDSRS